MEGGNENCGTGRGEKYKIDKYRNATLAFVKLASWPGLKLLGGSTNLPKQWSPRPRALTQNAPTALKWTMHTTQCTHLLHCRRQTGHNAKDKKFTGFSQSRILLDRILELSSHSVVCCPLSMFLGLRWIWWLWWIWRFSWFGESDYSGDSGEFGEFGDSGGWRISG